MSEGKPKQLVTPGAKNLMATFERGLTPMPKAAGFAQNQGKRPTFRNGKRRNITYPLSMHRETFDTKEKCEERFRELRASDAARDVCKGYDVDKWYVAWNGKAA